MSNISGSFRPQPRRVVVLEPQLLFLPHLVTMLEANGCTVVATMPVVDEPALLSLSPDVVFFDVGISGASAGLAALRRLRATLPRARLVVYGGASNPTWRATAWAQGVDEVLSDRDGTTEFIEAAHTAVLDPVPLPW